MKIIIIEDNEEQRKLLCEILNDHGFETECFAEPSVFIKRAPEFDFIVSDYNFEHVDLDFFIKAIDYKKLIIVTGSIDIVPIKCLTVIKKGNQFCYIQILELLKKYSESML